MSVRRRYSPASRSVAAGRAGIGRTRPSDRTVGDIGSLVALLGSIINQTIVIPNQADPHNQKRDSMSNRELSQAERDALSEALEDEYKSWATYNLVIADFGQIRPFINIRDAEARHIDALKRLFVRYNLTAPANTWIDCAPRFDSPLAACQYSVEAERENAGMYQRIQSNTENQDLLETFDRLAEASQQRHLPAFERCVQRYQRGGGNRGPGRG